MVVAHPIWSSLVFPPARAIGLGAWLWLAHLQDLLPAPPLQLTTNVTNKTNLFYINHAQASSNTSILNKDASLEVLLSHINLILSMFSSKKLQKR